MPVTEEPPHDLYPQADVFVLASAGESFGMVAAEAAAAGTPVDRLRPLRHRRLLRGRRGAHRSVRARAAVVEAVRQRPLGPELRERLARGGVAAARRTSWDHVTDVQEEIYRDVASRTAATKFSTDGS